MTETCGNCRWGKPDRHVYLAGMFELRTEDCVRCDVPLPPQVPKSVSMSPALVRDDYWCVLWRGRPDRADLLGTAA